MDTSAADQKKHDEHAESVDGGDPLEHSNGKHFEAETLAENRSGGEPNASSVCSPPSESELRELCGELLQDSELLDRVAYAMKEKGYVGDVSPPLLAYVGFASRLLRRPLNLAFVAPSAAGKNAAVDAARELVPSEAFFFCSAASPTALIYSHESFEHRIVVIAEADSIREDGPAASAMRSLAADNQLVYETVEKNREGQHETRRIVKAGPTGLITTSTKSLGLQMSTRTLEIHLADDAEQTRAIMRAQAKRANPNNDAEVDLQPYLALQQWLERFGERRVAVPFAGALADLVPSDAVRMRRDFKQLLTAIEAIALLFQCQRRRTPEGWVEATFDDYRQARRLLASTFEAMAHEGLTPVIRHTVEAVATGESVSQTELARSLKVSKGTVSWRVNRAVAHGWLVNSESRRGHPAKLKRGIELPDPTTSLPTVEQVRELFSAPSGVREGD